MSTCAERFERAFQAVMGAGRGRASRAGDLAPGAEAAFLAQAAAVTDADAFADAQWPDARVRAACHARLRQAGRSAITEALIVRAQGALAADCVSARVALADAAVALHAADLLSDWERDALTAPWAHALNAAA